MNILKDENQLSQDMTEYQRLLFDIQRNEKNIELKKTNIFPKILFDKFGVCKIKNKKNGNFYYYFSYARPNYMNDIEFFQNKEIEIVYMRLKSGNCAIYDFKILF